MSTFLGRVARRLFAIGLLALVVAGIGTAAVTVAGHYAATESQIRDASALLVRLEQALDKSREPVARSTASASTADLMMQEASKGLAVAALQTRLSDIAQTAGLRVKSAGELPVDDLGPVTLVGLRVEISGSDEAVGRLMYQIESSRPLLLIEGARLRASSASSEGLIDASLDVYAALRSVEAPVP